MPLLWLSAAFFLGLLVAAEAAFPWWVWLLALLAAIGLSVAQQTGKWQARWLRAAPLPIGIILAALLAGALRWQIAHPPVTPADLAWYARRGSASVTGVVMEDFGVSRSGIQSFLVKASQVSFPAGQASPVPVRGQVVLRIPFGTGIQIGNRVTASGLLESGSPSSSAGWAELNLNARLTMRMFYPQVSIIGYESPGLTATIHAVQRSTRATLNRLFPQPEAALLNGILLGYEADLPDDLSRAFKKTGTAHIIAISGFNMAILAGLMFSFLHRKIPLRFVVIITALVLTYYTILVGGSPSVVRAAVMAGFGLGGRLFGRQQVGVNSLAFCAAVMCLVNPDLPWSISFQLSFAATFGLIWLADPMTRGVTRLLEDTAPPRRARRIAGWLGEYFLFTLAAQALTLPVMAVQFGHVSWMALIANPLILPVQPAVMVLAGLALLLGVVWLPLGQVAAALVYPLAAYTNRMTLWLASLPGGEWVFPPLPGWLLTVALLLVAVIWVMNSKKVRWLPTAGVVISAMAAGLLWQAALNRPDGRLHLIIPEPGMGAAWWMETPSGQLVAVNGGEESTAWTGALAERMAFLNPRLDVMIVTRPDSSGLAAIVRLLDRYAPHNVLWNSQLADSAATNRVLTEFSAVESQIITWDSFQMFEVGNVRVTPASLTDRGGWLVIEQGNLVTVVGDVAANDETLARLPGNISALVVNSAALQSISGQELTRMAPAFVVWRSLSPLPKLDVPVLTGEVEFISDGERLWIAATGSPGMQAGVLP